MRGNMYLAAVEWLDRAIKGSSSTFGWEGTLLDVARLLDSYVAQRAQSDPLALPVAEFDEGGLVTHVGNPKARLVFFLFLILLLF